MITKHIFSPNGKPRDQEFLQENLGKDMGAPRLLRGHKMAVTSQDLWESITEEVNHCGLWLKTQAMSATATSSGAVCHFLFRHRAQWSGEEKKKKSSWTMAKDSQWPSSLPRWKALSLNSYRLLSSPTWDNTLMGSKGPSDSHTAGHTDYLILQPLPHYCILIF